jgi:hypothetical protein
LCYIVLKDRIAVSGIENGKTYEGDLTVTVDDPRLAGDLRSSGL